MGKRSGLLALLFVLGWGLQAQAQDREPSRSEQDETEPEELPPDEQSPESEPEPATASPVGAADAGVSTPEATPSVKPPAPEVQPKPKPEAQDEMIVTGSRIKQASSFAAAAPVQVIDRKQLEQTGATNMADVVSYLNLSQGAGFQGAGSLSVGTVSVNLRGLGEGATLVLLNGRRLPVTGAFNGNTQMFADLSTIPLSAVERIEVLKGGASAIYGTDAVAGVVNIITRKNMDGARVELDGQTTTRLDQKDGTLSAAWGSTSERSRVFLAGSYFRRTELDANQRDWTRGGYLSQQGFPGSFIVGSMTRPDPACSSVPGSMVIMGAAGQLCAFQYRNFAALSAEAERANLFGSGDFDITKHLTFFSELLGSRLRGGYISSPAFPIPPPFPTVPANHVDNPFGQNVLAIIRPVGAAAGGARAETDDDTMRGLVGLKGDFEDAAAGTLFESWQWELYASLASGRNRLLLPDTLRGAVQDALNSCSDPTNLSGCYNPFYSSIDGTGTANSTNLIHSFYGAQETLTDSRLQTYNGGMTGSLFKLPGGDVGLAFGGEARHEARSTKLDHEANENLYSFLIGNPNQKAQRDVYGGYLELRWPFYDGIELQTAGRVEHYTDIDRSALSPSAGLTLTPSEIGGRDKAPAALRRLQLRGHATSAFRAPNLYQSFPGYSTVPLALNVGETLPVYTPVQQFGNPALKPEHALAFSGGLSWIPIDEISLSTDVWYYDYKDRIELENAQTIVTQFLATRSDPRVIVDPTTGQVARVTPKQINIAGDVVTDGIDFSAFVILTNKTFGGTAPEQESHKLMLGAVGTYVLAFDYPRSEAAGRSVPASATTPARTLPPAHCTGNAPTDSCSAVGVRNFNNLWPSMPRLRANFPVTWSYLGHSVSFITHYISGYEDDVNPHADGSFDHISAWVTFDLQYGHTFKDFIGKELTVRIGVYNLLDADPPRVNGLTTSYDYEVHDPRGRMVYAKLSAQF